MKTKIGLLPFYIKLYDDLFPVERRKPLDDFYAALKESFQRKGLEVVTAPVCRLEKEFKAAVQKMERADVDAIVTLHLAYSPSLESAAVLARTRLPVIVLDTTPDFEFSPMQKTPRTMFNHGIHGVQDLCNLLIRRHKPFVIEAGHWKKSDVLERVKQAALAARMAKAIRNARVGQIGGAFKGMGDFVVPPSVMKRALGISVVKWNPIYSSTKSTARAAAVGKEMREQRMLYRIQPEATDAHRRSVKTGMAIRRWIEENKLTAFTANFLDVTPALGLPTMPFLEASLGMARGIGYAGEGDTLTAALVGALATVFPQTTFTEMFCPDWKGNRIFLSHMGEVNIDLLAGKPELVEYDFVFGKLPNPVKPAGCLRSGRAVWVNLAPVMEGKFRLIVSPVKMEDGGKKDRFGGAVHGWMRPAMPVADFLEAYSRSGGTHHAALVYGNALKAVCNFSTFMGWETVVI